MELIALYRVITKAPDGKKIEMATNLLEHSATEQARAYERLFAGYKFTIEKCGELK